jgi:hypothetical protein
VAYATWAAGSSLGVPVAERLGVSLKKALE